MESLDHTFRLGKAEFENKLKQEKVADPDLQLQYGNLLYYSQAYGSRDEVYQIYYWLIEDVISDSDLFISAFHNFINNTKRELLPINIEVFLKEDDPFYNAPIPDTLEIDNNLRLSQLYGWVKLKLIDQYQGRKPSELSHREMVLKWILDQESALKPKANNEQIKPEPANPHKHIFKTGYAWEVFQELCQVLVKPDRGQWSSISTIFQRFIQNKLLNTTHQRTLLSWSIENNFTNKSIAHHEKLSNEMPKSQTTIIDSYLIRANIIDKKA